MFHPCPLARFSVRETFNLWLFFNAVFVCRFRFALRALIGWSTPTPLVLNCTTVFVGSIISGGAGDGPRLGPLSLPVLGQCSFWATITET